MKRLGHFFQVLKLAMPAKITPNNYYGYCTLMKFVLCSLNSKGAFFPGGTLELFRWGCAAGTLEPLAYTRASSSEFCYSILDKTPQIPPPAHTYIAHIWQ